MKKVMPSASIFSFQDDMVTLNFSITESDVSISCKLCAHWYRTAHAAIVFSDAFLLDSLIKTMYIELEGFSNYRKTMKTTVKISILKLSHI